MTMSLNHTINLIIPFKKSCELWEYLRMCAIFVRHHILWVLYLFILVGVFVVCHFCKDPLFSNGSNPFSC